MPTIGFNLRKSRKNRFGKSRLRLYIRYRNKKARVEVPVYMDAKEWDTNKQRIKSKARHAKDRNAMLSAMLERAEGGMYKAFADHINPSLETIREYVVDALGFKGSQCFLKYARRIIKERYEDRGKIATSKRLYVVVAKLEAFNQGRTLPFDRLTVPFIESYRTHLQVKHGNSVNTIAKNLSSLRTINYAAIRDGITEVNPWSRIRITTEKTKKDPLSIADIEALAAVPLNPNTTVWHSRNIFMLAFFMGGIRISDMLRLEFENFKDGRYEWTQKKTETANAVPVIPQAQEIISLYENRIGRESFVFPFLDGLDLSDPKVLHNEINRATSRINKNLHNIRKRAGITSKVTTHIARHTFTNWALNQNVPLKMISQILGHASIKETEIYIAGFNNNAKDSAMTDLFAQR